MKRVFLIPGFFGFANLGDLRYFGHAYAFLRKRFAEEGIEASVHEVPTLPTASLKRRTQRLLDTVAATCGPDDAIHLVGHSSGGLDARMFTSPGVNLEVELEPWACRVESVITVATPHRGTSSAAAFSTLAGKRMLRLISLMTMIVIRRGSLPLAVLLEAGQLFRRFDGVLENGTGIVDEVFASLLNELNAERRDEIVAFFAQVGEDQALLPQIAPDAMDAFNVGTVDRVGVRYGSVLTRARRPGLHGIVDAGLRPYAQASNAMYVACHRLAAAGGPGFDASVQALTAYWPDLTAADNDGMVPTASQPWGQTIAAVDADHLDVIGHFAGDEVVPPHYDWIRTGTGYRRPAFETTWQKCFEFITA